MEPAEESATAATAGRKAERAGWRSLLWWPTLGGLLFAAFVSIDMFTGEESGRDIAPVVAASGLVYLAAAALKHRPTAWIVFLVSVVVITAAKLGWAPFDATWALLGMAGLFLVYGLARGAMRPSYGLPLQTIAMAGFGAIAGIALYVDETVGAYLVAAGLLAHAGWDFYHHQVNRVVGRSNGGVLLRAGRRARPGHLDDDYPRLNARRTPHVAKHLLGWCDAQALSWDARQIDPSAFSPRRSGAGSLVHL